MENIFRAIAVNIKVALPLVLLAACQNNASLEARLAQLARDNVGRSIDIRAATQFDWDEVAIFGPYSIKSNACKTLNLSRWGCFWLDFPKPEDGAPLMLAFLQAGKLVATTQISRCEGLKVVLRAGYGKKADRGSARFASHFDSNECQKGLYYLIQE